MPTVPSAGKRYRVLVILCFCIVLTMCTWFSASSVLPQLRQFWQLSDAQASWLTIAVQLGFVAGALVAALTQLPDRLSSPVLTASAAAGAAAVNLGILFSESIAWVLALRFLTGFFLAGVYPPALKFISTWFKEQRGLAMGAVIGALTLGSAVPHLVNAGLDMDWRYVLVATSIGTALGATGIITVLRVGPHPFPRTQFVPADVVPALLNKVVLLTTLGYLAHMWELYAMWAWVLLFMQSKLAAVGHDPSNAALWTFVIMAAGAPACLLAGQWADRIGRTTIVIIMLLGSGACAALIGFTYHAPLWMTLIIGVLWGATIIADSAQFSAMVSEGADPRFVGTALTAQLGLGFGLTTISIWIIPLMADKLGWQYAFLALVPGPLIGVLAMLALRRSPESLRFAGGRK